MPDTLFADVSEFQTAVDGTYPYPILSIRSNDGTYRDHQFPTNYPRMTDMLDSGKLVCGLVYCYWRSNWSATFETMQSMINSYGGLHPQVVLMNDLESGGNPGGDQSGGIDGLLDAMADWTGNPRRTTLYANRGDFFSMWGNYGAYVGRIGGVIGAGYGANPNLPGQIAHQYTDGVYSHPYKMLAHKKAGRPPLKGAMASLPLGCPPFGHCDMNSADGMTAQQFAAACGVGDVPAGNLAGMTDAQLAEFATNMRQLGPS